MIRYYWKKDLFTRAKNWINTQAIARQSLCQLIIITLYNNPISAGQIRKKERIRK